MGGKWSEQVKREHREAKEAYEQYRAELEEEFGNIMNDDDMPGPTCSACGNPAYPDCMQGCELLDDD